jgi:DsbC/DsbD-like thiol-disulfide interchange protein
MTRRTLTVAALLLLPAALLAQQFGNLDAPAKPRGHVVYAAESQNIKAGKPSILELHFKVDDGFHVNSHTPKSELLIPTQVTVQPSSGIKASPALYPAGTEYAFSFEPKEKLDVYTGDFVIKVPVIAAAGAHTIDGSLHYQACDHAACYPPKTLPLQVVFTAK